jgi:hypothetical protein|nr:MAG TPA: hypothetical protein [Siphoviridae sp. ctjRi1]
MAEAGRIFYPSLFDALEGADDATYSETLRAVAAFAFRGEEPVGLSPLARAIFTMAKPLFEANEAKREAGRKGGNARWEAARQAKAEEKAAAVCSSANSRDCGKYSTAISAMKAANATETETVTETVTETGTETGTETIALTETTSPTGQEKHIARKARTRTRKPAEEQKHKRGEFGHVLLTDAEYNRLCDEKGQTETDDAIRVVDEYAETSGKRYKNYSLAIQRWGYRAAAEQAAKERRAQIRPAGGFSAADYFARVARGEEAL